MYISIVVAFVPSCRQAHRDGPRKRSRNGRRGRLMVDRTILSISDARVLGIFLFVLSRSRVGSGNS